MRLVERVGSVMLYGNVQLSSRKKYGYNQQNLSFVLQVFCQSSTTSCLHVFSADTQNISDGHVGEGVG